MEPNGIPKLEDYSESSGGSKDGDKRERDIKPLPFRTTSRVPRACNACRKQKMRCEGADDPPCRRCRHANLVCLFEKPSRDATLTGEAGLERFKNLEGQVTNIQNSQSSIISSLDNITTYLQTGKFQHRPSSVYPTVQSLSPDADSVASPVTPTPSTSQSAQAPGTYDGAYGGVQSAHTHPQPYQGPLSTDTGAHISAQQPNANHSRPTQAYGTAQSNSHHLPAPGPPQLSRPGPSQPQHRQPRGKKRSASEAEKDEGGGLPTPGLRAPWEILRILADVANKRADVESADSEDSSLEDELEDEPHPWKRSKLQHANPPFPDVVTKGIVSEADARELFRIFFQGSSTFLPVLDVNTDTFDALRQRSPFAVNSICMVGARVRDGGGPPSETYIRCLEEVKTMSSETLFSPVTQPETIQAMILVSGWSDNGWLSGGHAVRMATELSMGKAWPKLFQRMKEGKHKINPEADRELVITSRIWFCLYLFEHQLSYGTGRSALMKDDETIFGCRLFLQHPLAIEDDMRLVSTMELMALREKVNNKILPLPQPLDNNAFQILHNASQEFKAWYVIWDDAFSQKYEDAAFYRQSLQNQQLHAELFHNATALTNITGPADVQRMPPAQRELAIRSIRIAQQGLSTTVSPTSYRKGMRYAVTYTHVAATFLASFLLRLARLFPDECDVEEIRRLVERLADLMATLPARRFALTLKLMLKKSRRRVSVPNVTLPTNQAPLQNAPAPSHQPAAPQIGHPVGMPAPHDLPAQYYAHYGEPSNVNVEPPQPMSALPYDAHANHGSMGAGSYIPGTQVEQQILGGYDAASMDQVPVWLSDQSLGGPSFSKHGMESFVMPTDYLNNHQAW